MFANLSLDFVPKYAQIYYLYIGNTAEHEGIWWLALLNLDTNLYRWPFLYIARIAQYTYTQSHSERIVYIVQRVQVTPTHILRRHMRL